MLLGVLYGFAICLTFCCVFLVDGVAWYVSDLVRFSSQFFGFLM
jgi:hypothetical protein